MKWVGLRAEVRAEFRRLAGEGKLEEALYRRYLKELGQARDRRALDLAFHRRRKRAYDAKYRREQPEYYRRKWREANHRRRAQDPDGVREYSAAWARAKSRRRRQALIEAGRWLTECTECRVPWMPLRRGIRRCSERCQTSAARRRGKEAKRVSYARNPGHYTRQERERRERNGDAVRAAEMARYHRKMREKRARRHPVHCAICGVEFWAVRKGYTCCSEECSRWRALIGTSRGKLKTERAQQASARRLRPGYSGPAL